MDEQVLEDIYQEKLEERIINYIADKNHIDYQTAMHIYYSSDLADKIHEGKYGIQYLDYKVLVELLEQYESDLIK